MRNKWTCHLKRSENMESEPWPELLRKMQRREDESPKQSNISRLDTSVKYPLPVASWSCICPGSDDIQHNIEYVTLFWSHEYTLFLEYNLSEEDNFKLEISSAEEAFELIEQDNDTTEAVYPQDKFKWKRILEINTHKYIFI